MNLDINTIVTLINAFSGSQEDSFDYVEFLNILVNVITKLIELLNTVKGMSM